MAKNKKYAAVAAQLDSEKMYSSSKALAFVADNPIVKFDPSVELHVNCNLDTRHADQTIRTFVTLPHGTGKKLSVVVFCDDPALEKACKESGADHVGGDDLIAKIAKNWTDFDVAIATPDMMKKMGKIAKILGTKGLMPNPKAGTVSPDPAKAVADAKGGKVEFRTDSYGIIHMIIGKASFGVDKLSENYETAIQAIRDAKPAGCKAALVSSAYITSSMGPSLKIDFS